MQNYRYNIFYRPSDAIRIFTLAACLKEYLGKSLRPMLSVAGFIALAPLVKLKAEKL